MNIPIEDAARPLVAYAESLGMLAIPQYFIVGVRLMPDGTQEPTTQRPFRFTLGGALEDLQQTEGQAGVALIVRFYDPEDPIEAATYAEHMAQAVRERQR